MLIVVIVLTLFASVAAFSLAVLRPRRESAMETRIHSFRNRNIYKDDLSVDLGVAFMDRVFKPGLESLANSFARVLPKSTLADVQQQLLMAGNPMPYNTFLTLWARRSAGCSASQPWGWPPSGRWPPLVSGCRAATWIWC